MTAPPLGVPTARTTPAAPASPPGRLKRAVTHGVLAACLVLGGGWGAGCVVGAVSEVEPTSVVTASGAGGTVDLEVLTQGSATLVLVPITIAGEGPYPFILDTGASSSAINADLADELGLEPTGERREVRGVTATQVVEIVAVENWRMGDIDLPDGTLGALNFPAPPDGQSAGPSVAGLLGSDQLSAFGSVTIDYDAEQLRLTPRPG